MNGFPRARRSSRATSRSTSRSTSRVKTAIVLPDDIFDRVEERARELSVSRSEFFQRAAAAYLADLDAQSQADRAGEAVQPEDAAPGESAGGAIATSPYCEFIGLSHGAPGRIRTCAPASGGRCSIP